MKKKRKQLTKEEFKAEIDRLREALDKIGDVQVAYAKLWEAAGEFLGHRGWHVGEKCCSKICMCGFDKLRKALETKP